MRRARGRLTLLSALDIKAWRDANAMLAQLLAIALVMACGVGLFIGMTATMRSLELARADYYAHQRFADVFVSLVRAPERVADELAAIPGVERLQTRVVVDVTLQVPGFAEAATGRLVSVPDHGRPLVNDLWLRAGRWPQPAHGDEVLVSEAFAEAHGLQPGARVAAVIKGRWQQLRIVGIALSPEYLYSVGPGQLLPDDRRFGVLWMSRAGLAPAADMDGAFNDVAMQVSRNVSVESVLDRTDSLLERWGGRGAIAREDQVSAFFIDNELEQLRTFGTILPILFLGVSAFLLHIVAGRLVATQREQIAVLKAIGYRDREIGLHFAKLVAAIVLLGCVAGIGLGAWMGGALTRLYVQYYRFPQLPFVLGPSDVATALLLSAAAAGLGMWGAVRRAVALPPAEAMRPEAPPSYRPTWIERLGLARWTPHSARMVLREIERRPWRAALSVFGIALATSLMVVTTFTFDAFHHMLQVQFGLVQRADVQLSLVEPRSLGVLAEVRKMPGVQRAEPFRTVGVRLRAGHRTRPQAITGVAADGALHGLLDRSLREVDLPEDGLVLGRKLAEVLGLQAGEPVIMEVLEGARPTREVTVTRVVDSYVGMAAYMRLEGLCRLLGEATALNGVWLEVDSARLADLHAEVVATPAIAGISMRDATIETMRRMLDENLGVSVGFSIVFSLIMALGVLYNTARITLAERARELASLRVLGFRRREVAAILIGEIATLVIVALPLGLVLGRLLAALLVSAPGFNSEQFRIPLIIEPQTYALAAGAIAAAAGLSCWSAWRRLDRLDIVQVLKTRD